MSREEVQGYVNQYTKLMDEQYTAYELYARRHDLTAKELFVLYLIWFAEDGCLQSEICERLSITKQTISAIVKKFWKRGYLLLTEAENDRRNKVIRFSEAGIEYARNIIIPIAEAEVDVMTELAGEEVLELVRLTALFTNCMKERFGNLPE